MHMKANDKNLGPEVVPVRFILEDPESTGPNRARN